MNSSSRRLALGAALIAPSLFLSAARGARVDDTIATVNDSPIFLSRYRKELSGAMNDMAQANPAAMRDPDFIKQLKNKVLDDLIDQELLYQQGKDLGIKVHQSDVDKALSEIKARFDVDENGNKLDPAQAEEAFQKQLKALGLSYEQYRKRLEKQVMAKKVLDEEVKSKVDPPTDAGTKTYFKTVAAFIASKSTTPPAGLRPYAAQDFMMAAGRIKAATSERVDVARILIHVSPTAPDAEKRRALRDADAVYQTLVSGTSTFSEVAEDQSEDSASASHGGDIGFIWKGALPPNLEKAVFSLDVGQISRPILNDEGYNILRVKSHQAAEAPDYDRFKGYLGQVLTDIQTHRVMDSYIKSLRAKAVIVKHAAALGLE